MVKEGFQQSKLSIQDLLSYLKEQNLNTIIQEMERELQNGYFQPTENSSEGRQ